jgi:hypothetical protein
MERRRTASGFSYSSFPDAFSFSCYCCSQTELAMCCGYFVRGVLKFPGGGLQKALLGQSGFRHFFLVAVVEDAFLTLPGAEGEDDMSEQWGIESETDLMMSTFFLPSSVGPRGYSKVSTRQCLEWQQLNARGEGLACGRGGARNLLAAHYVIRSN